MTELTEPSLSAEACIGLAHILEQRYGMAEDTASSLSAGVVEEV